jgi:hypothetical protein
MGLNMTLETAIAVLAGAAFACYLVYRWQEAVVDAAPEPYPVPESEPLTTEQVPPNWPFPTEKP